MALTYSSMLPLGTKIPSFTLENTLDDSTYDSNMLSNGKNSVIMLICNHCPYVIHYHNEIVRLWRDFGTQINFIAISSNDIENYPQDRPEKMKKLFNDLNINFPYLFDAEQSVAKSLMAECTPEFYLFNKSSSLIYRGRLDNSSPGKNIKITGEDLRKAIEAALKNEDLIIDQKPSMGCNIKWK